MKGSRSILADTWTVSIAGNTATWTEIASKGPSARYGAFYGFDAEANRFVVWSGAQQPKGKDQVNAASDAWALDLASDPPTWSKLAPSGETPPGRRNGCSMFDPIGRRLFVYGGTSDGLSGQPGLFVLDVVPGREAWTKLELPNAPPGRSSGFTFSLADGRVACGFGNNDDIYRDVIYLGY